MDIKIIKSKPEDVYKIRRVTKLTWLDTYPNKQAGITSTDIEAVFEKDSTPEGKKKMEERKERYKKPNIKIWVAKRNKEIIGFCFVVKDKKQNRVCAIYVLPEYQRRSIGQALIEKAFDWLGKTKDIFVNVASYNKKAIGFYKKFGFIETGKSGILDEAARLPFGKSIPEIEMVKRFT